MPSETFDARELRSVLGAFVTGVTIITTIDGAGKSCGLTANSFSSVSLDPPLILWSQSLSAESYPVFRDAARFAVNILAEHQVELSQRFATSSLEKFEGVRCMQGLGGVPLIEGCSAYLECRKVTSYPGGDHAVFLGQVERIDRTPRRPLAFGGGRYLVAHPYDVGAFSLDGGSADLAHLHAVRMATPIVAELAKELDVIVGLAVWANRGPTVVRWEEPKSPVRLNLRTGVVLPVLTSATGLVFATYLPREATANFISDEMELIARSAIRVLPSSPGELEQVLGEVREHGFARITAAPDFADLYGVDLDAISVPVFKRDGAIALALSAVGTANTLDANADNRVARELKLAGAALSRRLGHRAAAV